MSIIKLFKVKLRETISPEFAGRLLKMYLPIHNKIHNRIQAYLGEIAFNGYHPIVKFSNRTDFFIENLTKEDIVIDIACGNGKHLSKLSSYIKNGIGIDNSVTSINIAKENSKQLSNLSFILDDIFQFDYLKLHNHLEFNVALYSHILEHIENVPELLIKINAKKILIIVPSQEKWEVQMLKHYNLFYFSDYTHFREYTRAMLLADIAKTDYKVSFIGFNADGDIICSAEK